MVHTAAFGEIMLRFSPPGRQLLLQTPALDVWIAGAEANVATALARLGGRASMISALPANPLGDAAIGELRRHGVDCRHVSRRAGRMGTYYVVSGAGLRATEVLYDRDHSAFMAAPAAAWDWASLLAGVDRLHLSGITPALGPGPAEAAIIAARAARDRGIAVSFDGNYRDRLWSRWNGDARAILSEIVSYSSILFGNHRDIAMLLDRQFNEDDSTEAANAAAFEAFANLEMIASTQRLSDDVDRHRMRACVATRRETVRTDEVLLPGIVDRIGTGDAFAAGILHAIDRAEPLATIARTGLALSALKHSLPGDASLFDRSDLDHFLTGDMNVRR
jgi:2-dehydro-3-deoxygluconokinase